MRGGDGDVGERESGQGVAETGRSSEPVSPLRYITDLREHDVGYSMRCGIDLSLRVGAWFSVTPNEVGYRKLFFELVSIYLFRRVDWSNLCVCFVA